MEILQKCNVKGQTQKSKSPLFYKIVSVALWFCTLRRSSQCHGDHPPLLQTSLQLRWKLNFIIRWWHIYTVIKRKRSPFHIRNISVTQALKHLNHKKWGWLCNTKFIRREVPYIDDWATISAPADLIGGPSVYSCASTHHHVQSQYNDLLISVSGTLTLAHKTGLGQFHHIKHHLNRAVGGPMLTATSGDFLPEARRAPAGLPCSHLLCDPLVLLLLGHHSWLCLEKKKNRK